MRIPSFVKWLLPVVILITAGVKLIDISLSREAGDMRGYEMYNSAESALKAGEFETAYSLFIQSAYELEDPKAKALALYQAATTGWVGGIADYDTLVGLYKQTLRYKPGFEEASFDLELLYWLKQQNAGGLPSPQPGDQPSEEGVPSNGDV